MAGRQDRKMEVYVTAGELTPPSPDLPLGGNKVDKKRLLAYCRWRNSKRSENVFSDNRFWQGHGWKWKTLWQGRMQMWSSVIPGEYCAIPGLAFSLGISERCSVDAHAQGIPFVWCTLILGTLCCRYPLSWLKCASVSLFPMALLRSHIPTKSFGFSCSIIHAALQNICLCQVPANRQTVNLLYSCILKWKRTSASIFLPFPVKNNELLQLHLVCSVKGRQCVNCWFFPNWISFEVSKTSTIGQHWCASKISSKENPWHI